MASCDSVSDDEEYFDASEELNLQSRRHSALEQNSLGQDVFTRYSIPDRSDSCGHAGAELVNISTDSEEELAHRNQKRLERVGRVQDKKFDRPDIESDSPKSGKDAPQLLASVASDSRFCQHHVVQARDVLQDETTLRCPFDTSMNSVKNSSLERARATNATDPCKLVDDIINEQETKDLITNMNEKYKATLGRKMFGHYGAASPLASVSVDMQRKVSVMATSTPVLLGDHLIPGDFSDISDVETTKRPERASMMSDVSQCGGCVQCEGVQRTPVAAHCHKKDSASGHGSARPPAGHSGPTRAVLFVDLSPPKQEKVVSSQANDTSLSFEKTMYSTALEHIVDRAGTEHVGCEPDIISSTRSSKANSLDTPSVNNPDCETPSTIHTPDSSANDMFNTVIPHFNHTEPGIGVDEAFVTRPTPVAPPRKRKSARQAAAAAGTNAVFSFPIATLSRASSLRNLSGEGMPSLSIKTATLGRCLVSTQDADVEVKGEALAVTPTSQESIVSAVSSGCCAGEEQPHPTLSVAADAADSVCPLSRHIMQIAGENASVGSNECGGDSDGEGSKSVRSAQSSSTQRSFRKRSAQLKRFIGRAVLKVKSEVRSREETTSRVPEQGDGLDDAFVLRGWASSSHKGPYRFDKLRLVQDMSGEHKGPVWSARFSPCGRLLATGGHDSVIRVWALKESYKYFEDVRRKYNDVGVNSARYSGSVEEVEEVCSTHTTIEEQPAYKISNEDESPFMNKIFVSYRGHTSDVLDLSWSKNYFLLSSSMDKTVRLWHISRLECLCCFQHIDFVTAIVFHPSDDRYFLSGSLDGKLRLWSIPDKKVTFWNEVTGSSKLITAVNFCQHGHFAVVGTHDGRCIFYMTEQLKYFTTINVRSTRGKNSQGHKVTGIQPLPNDDKILVTTNDSRLRLYDLRDLSLTCKYKGCSNMSSQIHAGFSPDGHFILCGSEDHNIYFWQTFHESSKFTAMRRDRNDCWEAIPAHNAVVTAAVFAPHPNLFFNAREAQGTVQSVELLAMRASTSDSSRSAKSSASFSRLKAASLTKKAPPVCGYAIVTADYTGSIKVLLRSNDAT